MDDILDIIRNRNEYYNPKNEGISPKNDNTSRKTILFKRKYTKVQFQTMLKTIKSIYDKEVYNVIIKDKEKYDVEFVYPMELNLNPSDMNSNDVYELIIDVIDIPSKSEDEVRNIMQKVLTSFRKAGMPFEINSNDGKLFFHSKVVFQVV